MARCGLLNCITIIIIMPLQPIAVNAQRAVDVFDCHFILFAATGFVATQDTQLPRAWIIHCIPLLMLIRIHCAPAIFWPCVFTHRHPLSKNTRSAVHRSMGIGHPVRLRLTCTQPCAACGVLWLFVHVRKRLRRSIALVSALSDNPPLLKVKHVPPIVIPRWIGKQLFANLQRLLQCVT
jgi:hypothetical protein